MNIFNSLGSNYNFRFVLKALFASSNESHKKKLVKFLEKKYGGRAILLYKGREAIELALESLSLPKESYIAINGFTCVAVFNSIRKAGLEPHCLDLEETGGLNFTAKTLNKTLSKNKKIKAVIIQNTLGYPCDIEGIIKLCKKHNLMLIEDLAHCVGTKYKNGKEAGTVGNFVVLSFSQDKIIDAVSGGALIIRNKKYSNETIQQFNNVKNEQHLLDHFYPLFTFKIRKTYPIGLGKLIHLVLKKLNLLSKPMNEDFYDKYNLLSCYASLVLDNFKNLDKNLKHRRAIAKAYEKTINRSLVSDFINKNISFSCNLRYPIFAENRKSLIEYLKKNGIYLSDIWYDSVDESQENAKAVSDKILNLPTHINVSEDDAKNIAQKINQWLQSQ